MMGGWRWRRRKGGPVLARANGAKMRVAAQADTLAERTACYRSWG